MKYAILGPRHGILNVRDTLLIQDRPHVEITDEQAATVAALVADKKLPIWLNDDVTTREAQRAAGFRVQWNEAEGKLETVAIVAPVPQEVPAWRIKAAADVAGYTEDIEEFLEGLPAEVRPYALRVWNDGNVIERNAPTTLAVAAHLELTPEQVDEWFRQAAAVQV
jgi:hypothetical protein